MIINNLEKTDLCLADMDYQTLEKCRGCNCYIETLGDLGPMGSCIYSPFICTHIKIAGAVKHKSQINIYVGINHTGK